ncbi:MAG: Hsp20/alpha crystallin family protein [Bacteroidota bacterium]
MYNKRAFYKQMRQHKANQYGGCGMHSQKRAWRSKYNASFNYPPANVRELDDKYELYLYAPGYEKSDFIIALIDDRLSISVKEKKAEEGNWRRQEFAQQEFVREFSLSEKVDKSAIVAKYVNGVLILAIPKLEEFETSRQEIAID